MCRFSFSFARVSFLAAVCFGAGASAQSPLVQSIEAWQQEQNTSYSNREESPLDELDFAEFKGLPFFSIDTLYTVTAILEETPESLPFEMPTSTSRKPLYRVWGLARFRLNGVDCSLPVYVSVDLQKKPEFADYLFLPFTDETNGDESYGGGRYLDLRLPEHGRELQIDFNKAYNPYCAYSERYSCPLVPEANHLPFKVRAGVRAPEHRKSKKSHR